MNLVADTCCCGGSDWHQMLDRVFWCRRCGAIRPYMSETWMIPLDRAGEVASSVKLQVPQEDETPTSPGTPKSKNRSGEWKK